MKGEASNPLLDGAKAPCFSCPNCYNCKFWRSTIWTNWILNNAQCPVGTYTFESIIYAYALQQKGIEKKKQHQYRWDEYSKKTK